MAGGFTITMANGSTINIPAGEGFTITMKPAGSGAGAGVGGVHPPPPLSSSQKPIESSPETANPKVFFDMTVDGKPAGRIVMELFADTTPRTAENFRALCTGEKGMGTLGKPLHYKGSIIHHLDPGYMLCGGDFVAGNGTGGESIYGSKFFDDENFIKKHTGPGILSMANRGPDTNGSEFRICMTRSFQLDDECVAFGQVVEGLDVIRSIEKDVPTVGVRPSKPVVIADCGQIS